MAAEKRTYFELAEHNTLQVAVYVILLFLGVFFTFSFLLPFMEFIFEKFLNGVVYNGGEKVQYLIDYGEDLRETSYIFSWAVDIYVDTPQEARYWFNPFVSMFIPSLIMGLGISVFITVLLPPSLGFIRQKIDREIAIIIDRICIKKYGYYGNDERNEIIDDIKNANLRELHEYVEFWNISLEDIKILHRALVWVDSSLFYKIIHINDGIRTYMRFYFTVIYSNAVLGFVYIGAAVLIIIIGLRGLKFVPSTQPSLVFFALGLEFSLLVIYAFTLMYSRQEEEQEAEQGDGSGSEAALKGDYANSKEVEQLLRVFINTEIKDKDK